MKLTSPTKQDLIILIALIIILLLLLNFSEARAEVSRELPPPQPVGMVVNAPGAMTLYWTQHSAAKLVVVIRVQENGEEHIIAQIPGTQDKYFSVSDAIIPGAKYFINETDWTAGEDVWGTHNGPYSYAQNGLQVQRIYLPLLQEQSS